MPVIAAILVVLPLVALVVAVFATRRAESRMGGHPSVNLLYRAYGA
jgi:hypothetical protein